MNMHADSGQDPAIDAALARLPQWQPPADFATRLAAAAARQHAQPAYGQRRDWFWLDWITQVVLAMLGAGMLALLLIVLPWVELLAHPAFAWVSATGFAGLGLVLASRLLRAR